MNFEIRPFQRSSFEEVLNFSDKWIGQGYFTKKELESILELSLQNELNASFLAYDKNQLAAIRLSFAPGDWVASFDQGLSFDLWESSKKEMSYFKSLFVAKKYQKQGLGKQLSLNSLEVLKEMGAKAVCCHCWFESPAQSSQRYLESIGFEAIKTHPLFWQSLDYECVRCRPHPCECTALEMVKYL